MQAVTKDTSVTRYDGCTGTYVIDAVQLKLSALWVAPRLTYLLGDVLRVFSGDVKPGELSGVQATPGMYLGVVVLMVIPIVMVVLTLMLPYPTVRWGNIIVALVFVVSNLFGLPYPGAYDTFLIIVSFVFDALTVPYAWTWV